MVSAVPNSSAIIAGIAQKGLWQSTVDGTWTQLGTGGSSDVITNRPSSISYDPANASTFYEFGIYNSYGAYKNSRSTHTHDFNGDGKSDIAYGLSSTSASISYFRLESR